MDEAKKKDILGRLNQASKNTLNETLDIVYTDVSDINVKSNSIVVATIVVSTDHPNPIEFMMNPIILSTGNIIDSTSFTIYANAINGGQGVYNIYYKIIT